MVFKGHGRTETENSSMVPKQQVGKFHAKSRSGNFQYVSTNSSATCTEYTKLSEQDIQVRSTVKIFLELY